MSVRSSFEIIESLKVLADSKIKVVILNFLPPYLKGNEVLTQILENAVKDETIINFQQFHAQEKWIKGLSEGTHSIVMFEIPFEKRLITFYEKSQQLPKVTHLEDFSWSIQSVIAFNRKLNKNMRRLLNLR